MFTGIKGLRWDLGHLQLIEVQYIMNDVEISRGRGLDGGWSIAF